MNNKPEWIKIKLQGGRNFTKIKNLVKKHNIHTICEEALCPNIFECWGCGTAAFLVLGDLCTRTCKFCSVKSGNPHGSLNSAEPRQIADSARKMQLSYVVLTSVDRDDLPDGGASHFSDCVNAIKNTSSGILVEVLTPDFRGNFNSVKTVLKSSPDVFAHNIETVERLQKTVRDWRANYKQSLSVLEYAKIHSDKFIKSSFAVGFGETSDEVVKTLQDLRSIGVDIVTIGQYLQPTKKHLKVAEYVPLQRFKEYEEIGKSLGFLQVVSAPFVRSSYKAVEVFIKSKIEKVQHHIVAR